MAQMHFCVNMDDLMEIESALGKAKDKSKMVLKTAINNAAKQTENSMVDKTKAKYRYKRGTKGDIRAANTVHKAKVSNMAASIEAKGRVNEFLSFYVRPSAYFPGGKGAPKWVKARVLRRSAFHKIALRPEASGDKYKAFVIQYHSGHQALAQRVPGKKMSSKPKKEFVKSLLSVSTPKMEETVYKEEIDEDMYDLLQRNIQEQIQRFLG